MEAERLGGNESSGGSRPPAVSDDVEGLFNRLGSGPYTSKELTQLVDDLLKLNEVHSFLSSDQVETLKSVKSLLSGASIVSQVQGRMGLFEVLSTASGLEGSQLAYFAAGRLEELSAAWNKYTDILTSDVLTKLYERPIEEQGPFLVEFAGNVVELHQQLSDLGIDLEGTALDGFVEEFGDGIPQFSQTFNSGSGPQPFNLQSLILGVSSLIRGGADEVLSAAMKSEGVVLTEEQESALTLAAGRAETVYEVNSAPVEFSSYTDYMKKLWGVMGDNPTVDQLKALRAEAFDMRANRAAQLGLPRDMNLWSPSQFALANADPTFASFDSVIELFWNNDDLEVSGIFDLPGSVPLPQSIVSDIVGDLLVFWETSLISAEVHLKRYSGTETEEYDLVKNEGARITALKNTYLNATSLALQNL